MFYYFFGNKKFGPVDERAILYLIDTGKISKDTLIQKEGWKSARRALVVFKNAFSEPEPVIPDNSPHIERFKDNILPKLYRIRFSPTGCLSVILFFFMVMGAGALMSKDIEAIAGIVMILICSFLSGFVIWLWQKEGIKDNKNREQLLDARQDKLDLYKSKLIDNYNKLKEMQSKIFQAHDAEIIRRCNALAVRHLEENIEWISAKLKSDNYPQAKERLITAINSCRTIGYKISEDEEKRLVGILQEQYEKILRREAEREEQARIKAQIREEQRIQRELEAMREKQRQAEREQHALEKAIQDALAQAHGEHSLEIQEMQKKLAEKQAELEANQRTLSNAEKGIKAGNVYVISNIGSFGKDIFKVGMTRRLEPMDRVKELGDASVPFPFDVHMMIQCEDAPSLESALHKALRHQRVNKVNLRKEFFKSTIDELTTLVEQHHGKVEYVADPEALEYFQSLNMKPEDEEFLEKAFEDVPDLDE